LIFFFLSVLGIKPKLGLGNSRQGLAVCSPGQSCTCRQIFLSRPPECWDCGGVPPSQVFLGFYVNTSIRYLLVCLLLIFFSLYI
jgi:hypothetical protein